METSEDFFSREAAEGLRERQNPARPDGVVGALVPSAYARAARPPKLPGAFAIPSPSAATKLDHALRARWCAVLSERGDPTQAPPQHPPAPGCCICGSASRHGTPRSFRRVAASATHHVMCRVRNAPLDLCCRASLRRAVIAPGPARIGPADVCAGQASGLASRPERSEDQLANDESVIHGATRRLRQGRVAGEGR